MLRFVIVFAHLISIKEFWLVDWKEIKASICHNIMIYIHNNQSGHGQGSTLVEVIQRNQITQIGSLIFNEPSYGATCR